MPVGRLTIKECRSESDWRQRPGSSTITGPRRASRFLPGGDLGCLSAELGSKSVFQFPVPHSALCPISRCFECLFSKFDTSAHSFSLGMPMLIFSFSILYHGFVFSKLGFFAVAGPTVRSPPPKTVLPTTTAAPEWPYQREIRKRDEASTCGSIYGVPDWLAVAPQGHTCTTSSNLFGLCSVGATACFLAEACIDGHSCSKGCGPSSASLSYIWYDLFLSNYDHGMVH